MVTMKMLDNAWGELEFRLDVGTLDITGGTC